MQPLDLVPHGRFSVRLVALHLVLVACWNVSGDDLGGGDDGWWKWVFGPKLRVTKVFSKR